MHRLWAALLMSCCLYPGHTLAQERVSPPAIDSLDLLQKTIASRPPNDASLPDLLDQIAEMQYRTGRFSEAERSLARALAIRGRALGADHPYLAVSMNNLAEVLFAQARYKDAELYDRRALQLLALGNPPDLELQARCLASLGKVLTARRSYRDAGQALSRALDQWTALGNSFEQAVTSGNLALLMTHRGQYVQAEQYHRRALDLLDPSHPNAIAARVNLADLLRMQKRYDESELQFHAALPVLEERVGREHPDRAAALTLYAKLLRDTHRTGEANRLLAEARRIRQTHARTDGSAWVIDASARQSMVKPPPPMPTPTTHR